MLSQWFYFCHLPSLPTTKVQTHNDYFSSLSTELCTEVNKDIILNDLSQWYASIVNLRRQRRRAEHRWRRVRHQNVVALYAVAQHKSEYYRNQTASCDGNQERLFKVMDNFMEGRSYLMLPNSLSDADLTSSFSDFFSEKIMCIRHELDLDLCSCVISVAFDASPRMITTVLLYYEHIPLQMLQEIIRETKKIVCFLDPINVTKAESIYMFSAPFTKKMINQCLDESTFVSTEK